MITSMIQRIYHDKLALIMRINIFIIYYAVIVFLQLVTNPKKKFYAVKKL